MISSYLDYITETPEESYNQLMKLNKVDFKIKGISQNRTSIVYKRTSPKGRVIIKKR